MGGFEVAMVLASMAAGACLMRLHEIDKEKALGVEKREVERLRVELKAARIRCYRDMATHSNPASCFGDELAPSPLLFGPEQEADLRDRGAAVVIGRRGRGNG